MSQLKKTIIANWKMNPASLEDATALFQATQELALAHPSVNIVVCPPFVYLEELAKLWQPGKNVFLGAQDFHWEDAGAFTGEISLSMLKQFGVSHVLVGHSERRVTETDEMVNHKVLAALQHGMTAVLLVGEKERGDYKEDILIDQLSQDLKDVQSDQAADHLIVAYEPVWAISSHSGGESDTPQSAVDSIGTVQKILTKMWGRDTAAHMPMFYGGSVNPDNVESFMARPEIAGAVVGAASLDATKLSHLLTIIAQYSHD